MKRFFLVFVMMVSLSACAGDTPMATSATSDSATSYEETWERAESLPVLNLSMGQLGTQKCRPLANILTQAFRKDYDCRDRTIKTPKGNINIGLGFPAWYWELPAPTSIRFVYQEDVSKRVPLHRVLYLETNNFKTLRHYNYNYKN